jgi:formate hydrogenlyase subunit 3/multisubunit Na+/H+ antiporter MnhD subunit
MTATLLIAVTLPALLALPVALRTRLRRPALSLAPWAALPSLALAIWPELAPPAHFPALLFGMRLALDQVAQIFLFFTAFLWTIAGVYARAYLARDPAQHRFFAFHLLTLTGNLGLIAAQDLVTFYVAFALMTFAGYPLVVHARDATALRAGRVYVVMAVIGETMLLAGFLLAASGAESLELAAVAAAVGVSPWRTAIVLLLLAGFGIKAGALPLHVWLPLAHPVAPTPASAVLSGSMIKAGLLGWLRFLPLGLVALPTWGAVLIGLGLAAAVFGVLIGVTQTDPKTALAYSSISQMGIINVAVGTGLASPDGWGSALSACLVYVVHHGLAKAALFLGVGVAMAAADSRAAWRWSIAGLAFAALAVAGAPLTSGMVAKEYLKEIAPLSPAAWPALLDLTLPLTAVGTTLLMARFLFLVARTRDPAHHRLSRALWVPWLLLLLGVAGVAWVLPGYYELEIDPPGLPYPGAVWVSIWPIVVGGLLIWSALLVTRRTRLTLARLHVEPGDLLVGLEWLFGKARGRLIAPRVREPMNPVMVFASRWYGIYARPDRRSTVLKLERQLTVWTMAGLLAVLLAAAIVGLLLV